MAFHPVKFHNIDKPGKTEDAGAADNVSSLWGIAGSLCSPWYYLP